MVVVPVADCDDLSEAKVKCVGEHLHEFVETRLGQIPPPDVEVDATILRSLAPLDSGVRAFLSQSAKVLSATIVDAPVSPATRADLPAFAVPASTTRASP